jgi:hypothetical protein
MYSGACHHVKRKRDGSNLLQFSHSGPDLLTIHGSSIICLDLDSTHCPNQKYATPVSDLLATREEIDRLRSVEVLEPPRHDSQNTGQNLERRSFGQPLRGKGKIAFLSKYDEAKRAPQSIVKRGVSSQLAKVLWIVW